MYNHDLTNKLFDLFDFPRLEDISKYFNSKVTFPHFDVEREGSKITYAFALAGYTRECFDIAVENGILKLFVSSPTAKKNVEYLYKGLTERSIELTLPLPFGNKFINQKASFVDGVLRIEFDLEPSTYKKLKLEVN